MHETSTGLRGIGIMGNLQMTMDNNNLDMAALIQSWLEGKG